MQKRKLHLETRFFYRRQFVPTIYGRDEFGRYHCYKLEDLGRGLRARKLPGGITKLGPIFGRVDFSNGTRFSGRTRSQPTLAVRFNATSRVISTGWVSLPYSRSRTRRQSNQGMDAAMLTLTGGACSATRYAIWCNGRHPEMGIKTNNPWEWCHLLSHAMGGVDNPTNIVAAVKGNNSEQLAIETALQMYRCENAFSMNISAGCLGTLDAQHIGDVIKYEIRCKFGGENFVRYLDCLNAPAPSEYHYYDLLRSVTSWANKKLVSTSEQVFGNGVTRTEEQIVTRCV